MLTKNEIKYLRSLHQKKEREATHCFLCEGEKLVNEAISSDFTVRAIFVRKGTDTSGYENVREISVADMERISAMATPPGIIAMVQYPESKKPEISSLKDKLFLILDGINDPGNLGTIIRIADWFGIEHVFCSENSADIFNSKTVQASMGGIFRVNVHYGSLSSLTTDAITSGIPLFAAVMNGEPVLPGFCANGGIILGSESHGISNKLISEKVAKITIPSYGKAESLNVAVAAGILCAFTRIK